MKKFIITALCFASAFIAKAQTDSLGVYSVCGTETQRIDMLSYAGAKVKLTSPWTAKTKLVFGGEKSLNRFAGTATFRLYFGPIPDYMARYYMFAPTYSINDFSIGKFDVKKGDRYLTANKVSPFRTSTGVKNTDEITMDIKKISESVYEITISGPAGEYCIMPTIKGTSGYTDVFDFALDEP